MSHADGRYTCEGTVRLGQRRVVWSFCSQSEEQSADDSSADNSDEGQDSDGTVDETNGSPTSSTDRCCWSDDLDTAKASRSTTFPARCTRVISGAKRAGETVRLRVSGTYGLFGVVLTIVGFLLFLNTKWPFWTDVLGEALWHWGLIILSLAVLPTDRHLVYILVVAGSSVFAVMFVHIFATNGHSVLALVRHVEEQGGENDDLAWDVVHLSTKFGMSLASGLSSLVLAQSLLRFYPRNLLEVYWTVIYVYAFVMLMLDIIKFAGSLLFSPAPEVEGRGQSYQFMSWCWIPNEALMVLVLSIPSFRYRAQVLVARGSGAVHIAAAISSLLNRGDQQETLRKAIGLFRSVSCGVLTEDMMKNNSPDNRLFDLSRKACLGEVDAFLSHSWHDDPAAKWAVLQSWREQFKEENHGREPVVWIDKVCLDQSNIDESLQCLPIFLSGCNQLLILAGETYLTRLWCIVELFVFLAGGGKFRNLVIRPLKGYDLEADLDHFEASKVTCSRPDDKDRLLAFIDAGFGNLQRFSEEVKGVISKASSYNSADDLLPAKWVVWSY